MANKKRNHGVESNETNNRNEQKADSESEWREETSGAGKVVQEIRVPRGYVSGHERGTGTDNAGRAAVVQRDHERFLSDAAQDRVIHAKPGELVNRMAGPPRQGDGVSGTATTVRDGER